MNVSSLALILSYLVLFKFIQGYNIPYERNSDARSRLMDALSVNMIHRDENQQLLEELEGEKKEFKKQEKEILSTDNDNVFGKLFADMAEKKRVEIDALPMNDENLLDMQFADMVDLEEEEKELSSLEYENMLSNQFADKSDVKIDNSGPLTANYDTTLVKRDIDVNGLKQYQCKLSYGLVVGSSCFVIGVRKRNWLDAKTFCERHDARLGEIHNALTNFQLMDYIRDTKMLNARDSLWLGGSDREREGLWKWAGSRQTFGYTYWVAPEPNNDNNEDCLSIVYLGSNHFKWNDSTCSNVKWFVCEWSIN